MSGDVIHRTGRDAWNALAQCGLEPEGRDSDFVEALRQTLDAEASNLEIALERCTTEQFIRAFIATAGPYVEMLKGILRMFECAGVTQGAAHWKISFDDYEESVEHFKQWEKIFKNIGVEVECPVLTLGEWDELASALRIQPIAVRKGDSHSYWDTNKPWASLHAPGVDGEPWMHDLWAILLRAQKIFADAGFNLITARKNLTWSNNNQENELELDGLRRFQHDYQLSQLIAAYEVLWADRDTQQKVGSHISTLLKSCPRIRFRAQATIDELRPFLDLPVWTRRHEFYAAWVAAEQIDVFREAGISVHSQNGEITFPFRETRVATLADSSWTLVSERRTFLANPVGKGRLAGVQPDYSWWREHESGSEVCGLVVEVKHYKKAARGPWVDVLTDYAKAHPSANILLVNYGPAGKADTHILEELRGRCHVIGELRPGSTAALEYFRQIVTGLAGSRRGVHRVIVLDMSSSMELRSRQIASSLKDLASAFDCKQVWAVDDEIIEELEAVTLSDIAITQLLRGRVEMLASPLMTALATHESVLLVSDESGLRNILGDERFTTSSADFGGDVNFKVLEVRKA